MPTWFTSLPGLHLSSIILNKSNKRWMVSSSGHPQRPAPTSAHYVGQGHPNDSGVQLCFHPLLHGQHFFATN